MLRTASNSTDSSAPRKVGRHRIRKAIEQMILDGQFLPGEKLVQFRLTKKFGVSQGLIREALFELKEGGLVETSDNRGMFVRSLDARSMHEMLVIREVFDGVTARECCGRLTTDDAAELRGMADKIFDLAVAGRQKEKTQLDRQFHLEIARLTGNRILMMWARQHHVLGKVIGVVRDPEETYRGHHALINAMLAGDPDEAEKMAREHVRVVWPALQEAMAHGSSAIQWVTENKPFKKKR